MTIDEALEILTLYLQHSDQWNHYDLDKAIQLVITVLTDIIKTRKDILQ